MTKYPAKFNTSTITVLEQTGTASLTLSGPVTGTEDTWYNFTGKLSAVTNIITTPFNLPGEELKIYTSKDQVTWTLVLPAEGAQVITSAATSGDNYTFQLKFDIGGTWYVRSHWDGGTR